MASIEFDEASKRYRIRFRYGGKPYKRSLKTTEKREAEAVVGRVEETIRLLERGRIDIPLGADPGVFILSDGKLNEKLTAEHKTTCSFRQRVSPGTMGKWRRLDANSTWILSRSTP